MRYVVGALRLPTLLYKRAMGDGIKEQWRVRFTYPPYDKGATGM